MISDQSIEEVKNRIDIVDVISDFVNLKKAGQNYKALSPFNDEKTPSFYVAPHKGLYKDFSSGKGGDAINFVMEHEGLDFLDAIRYLAGKYGVDLEESEITDEALEKQNERESLYIILNFASEYFRQNLHETDEGRNIGLSYLRERGLTDSVIQSFELGYSPDKWDGLLKAALEKGFSEEILENAGLIIKKDEKKYDRFRGRVIFPVHNLTGKTIAFGARILTQDKKQPKYINSPETAIYHKSDVLYGLFQAKNDIRKNDNCYLVEGYTDVISLHQSDIKNVVASSGTSLTDQQIKLISRYTENITILFDGDAAGVQASLRGVDMILEKGLNARIVILPDGEDPDSFVSKMGSSGFSEYVREHSKDFIAFKAGYYAEKAGNEPGGKAEAIREVLSSIVKIPDPIRRAVYLKDSAGLFNIEESLLIAESNRILLEERKKQRRKKEYDESKLIPAQPSDLDISDGVEETYLSLDDIIADQEMECIRLLVNYGIFEAEEDYLFHDYFFEEIEDIKLLNKSAVSIMSLYREALSKDTTPDHEYFIRYGSDPIKNIIAELYFEKYTLSENWEVKFDITVLKEREMLDKIFSRNILLLKFRHTQKLLQREKERLNDVQSKEEEEEIITHYMEYKKFEMAYAKELGIIING